MATGSIHKVLACKTSLYDSLLPDYNFLTAERSISRVFSLLIVPSPFSLYITHIKAVLTGLKPYSPRIKTSVTNFENGAKTENIVRQ